MRCEAMAYGHMQCIGACKFPDSCGITPTKDLSLFAESTVDATIWLAQYHPERLDKWLEDHKPGATLMAMAIEKTYQAISAE